MNLSRDEVLAQLEKNREAIRRYGVRRIGLFGSCARGEASPTSDLDFLVEFERKTFDGYMDLKDFLERQFDCRVDLVLADTLKPRIRERILQETIYATGL